MSHLPGAVRVDPDSQHSLESLKIPSNSRGRLGLPYNFRNWSQKVSGTGRSCVVHFSKAYFIPVIKIETELYRLHGILQQQVSCQELLPHSQSPFL